MVFTVGGHVRCQLLDSPGQQRYLYLGAAGIAFFGSVIGDNLRLFLFIQICLSASVISAYLRQNYNIIWPVSKFSLRAVPFGFGRFWMLSPFIPLSNRFILVLDFYFV
jgi:hypothetical protein